MTKLFAASPDERRLSNVSDTELAWLAGILEGECSFSWCGRQPVLALEMTDKDIIERVASLWGKEVGGSRSRGPRCKPQWRVCVGGWNAVDVMQAILPYLGARRTRRVEELIERHANQGSKRKVRGMCGRGHLLTAENLYVSVTGGRKCRQCALDYDRRRRKPKLTAVADSPAQENLTEAEVIE